MKKLPKFKAGDRVVYKKGTKYEDAGILESINGVFCKCNWDSSGNIQMCLEESLELEHVANSPLYQELK